MKFLSQTGATLLQGLVVSAVIAGSALVATRLVQDQKLMMKGVETRDQIEQLHRVIFGILQNREHCDATFVRSDSSVRLNADNASLGLNVPVTSIRTKVASAIPTFTTVYEPNTGATYDPSKIYMNGNIMIHSMNFRTPAPTDPVRERVITYPSKLQIVYSRLEGSDANKRTKMGFGAKRVMKEISILLQLGAEESPGVWDVTGCYAVQMGSSNNGQTLEGNNNLNQEFCSNLGSGGSLYTWNSLQNKCVLKNNICPSKYVFVGIKSDGNAECKPLSYFLPYMVNTNGATACDTTSGAQVSLTTDAFGKVQINCVASAPACTPQSPSATPTPTIDEDCDGNMDNTTPYTPACYYPCATYISNLNFGAAYSVPASIPAGSSCNGFAVNFERVSFSSSSTTMNYWYSNDTCTNMGSFGDGPSTPGRDIYSASGTVPSTASDGNDMTSTACYPIGGVRSLQMTSPQSAWGTCGIYYSAPATVLYY